MLNDMHQTGCVLTVLICHTRQQRISEQLHTDLVLEGNASDGYTKTLAEDAEEGVEGYGVACVFLTAGGLDREAHCWEEHACADGDADVDEDPLYDARFDVEKDEDA